MPDTVFVTTPGASDTRNAVAQAMTDAGASWAFSPVRNELIFTSGDGPLAVVMEEGIDTTKIDAIADQSLRAMAAYSLEQIKNA